MEIRARCAPGDKSGRGARDCRDRLNGGLFRVAAIAVQPDAASGPAGKPGLHGDPGASVRQRLEDLHHLRAAQHRRMARLHRQGHGGYEEPVRGHGDLRQQRQLFRWRLDRADALPKVALRHRRRPDNYSCFGRRRSVGGKSRMAAGHRAGTRSLSSRTQLLGWSGSRTGPTPGMAWARASASSAAAACAAFSPVRDMRAAIRPVTIGVEKDVPLHFAMP